MAADPRALELLSYHRDAEPHGAGLLRRLMRRLRTIELADGRIIRDVAAPERRLRLVPDGERP